jgi:hypothetical protein
MEINGGRGTLGAGRIRWRFNLFRPVIDHRGGSLKA